MSNLTSSVDGKVNGNFSSKQGAPGIAPPSVLRSGLVFRLFFQLFLEDTHAITAAHLINFKWVHFTEQYV